jgi:NitT/TauT family transport system substrate-binding protein
MTGQGLYRRLLLAGAMGAAAGAGLRPRSANAAEKIRFLTNWFAEAEHGGFYQAQATGLYAKEGLNVDIRMGGPQINGIQLLAAGEADLMMGYDIQVLNSLEHGIPLTTLAAAFQFDLAGFMAHTDVPDLAALKSHRVLVSGAAYTTYWPWLKERFGFSDAQAGPYTFNLQPFFADPQIAVQGYATSEPFEAQEHHVPAKFFLFADAGYPPYATTLVAMQPVVAQRRAAMAGFVRASMAGWRSYLQDPAPGNRLIQAANPKMTDAQLKYSVDRMRAIKVVNGGDAATQGIGIMTEARWQKTHDFMVKGGLLKPQTDWKQAFTTEFVRDLHITLP